VWFFEQKQARPPRGRYSRAPSKGPRNESTFFPLLSDREHLAAGDRRRRDRGLGRHLDGVDDGLGRGEDGVDDVHGAGAGGQVELDELGGGGAGGRRRDGDDLVSVLGDDDRRHLGQPGLERLAGHPLGGLEPGRGLDDVLLENVLEVGAREQLGLGDLGGLEVRVERGVVGREDGEDRLRVVELRRQVGGFDRGGERGEGGVGLDEGEGGGRGCVFFYWGGSRGCEVAGGRGSIFSLLS